MLGQVKGLCFREYTLGYCQVLWAGIVMGILTSSPTSVFQGAGHYLYETGSRQEVVSHILSIALLENLDLYIPFSVHIYTVVSLESPD